MKIWIIGIFILIGFLLFGGYLGIGSFFQGEGKYVYSQTTSRQSCNQDSPYDKVLGDYKTKINVALSQHDGDSVLFNDNKFIWNIGLRTSSETYSSADDGLPPQIRCDGTKDCNYGYTTEKFVLHGDGNCYVQVAQNNQQSIQQSTMFFQRLVILIKYYWGQLWN